MFPVLHEDRKLTALPVGVAELQVPAGAGRALLGAVRTADVLHLIVERLQTGVHLCIVLDITFGGLVCPHVLQGFRTLLRMRQTSESRQIDAGPRWARETRGTRVSWGALRRSSV